MTDVALEDLTVPFDSDAWVSDDDVLAVITTSGLQTLSGDARAATVETDELRPSLAYMSRVLNARPVCDGGTPSVAIGSRTKPMDDVTYSTAVAMADTGDWAGSSVSTTTATRSRPAPRGCGDKNRPLGVRQPRRGGRSGGEGRCDAIAVHGGHDRGLRHQPFPAARAITVARCVEKGGQRQRRFRGDALDGLQPHKRHARGRGERAAAVAKSCHSSWSG